MVDPGSTSSNGAQTLRGHRRRNLILKEAAKLFAGEGYDRVSINDIGNAAGVSGPAIYRYFKSKEQVLVAIYEDLQGRYVEGLRDVTSAHESPRDTVEGLIDLHLRLAVDDPEKIRIISNEDRHLPTDVAERLRGERAQHLRIWADLLRQIHPTWSADEVDVTVHAIYALINSISFRRNRGAVPARLVQHLRERALQVAFESVGTPR